MDKETLSNYGWIVILVLILAVMIALASPFGTFIAGAIKSTTAGLFDVNQNALGTAGIVIGDQEFQCNHEYEDAKCKHCGAVDPNHTHTYPATGLTAKCENCDYIKDHTCSYDSDNLCTLCGQEKPDPNNCTHTFDNASDMKCNACNTTFIAYAFKASDYDKKMGTTTKTDAHVEIPETFEYGGKFYRVKSIGQDAFSNCTSLTSVVIPNSVTSFENYAFWKCSALESINIPDSVTKLGANAIFYCDSLTTIHIPSSVTQIVGPKLSLHSQNLVSITVDENNKHFCSVDGVLYTKSMDTILAYPEKKVGTAYSIPNSVTKIGDYAFSACRMLESIFVPDSVTDIGSRAFGECENLKNVNIPDGIKTIKEYTFYYCFALSSITIPDSVTFIDRCAFYKCSSLESIIIPANVTRIGDGVFSHCDKLKSIIFENPNGWWYGSKTATTGTTLATDDLVNPSTAATLLRYTYSDYYISRSVE